MRRDHPISFLSALFNVRRVKDSYDLLFPKAGFHHLIVKGKPVKLLREHRAVTFLVSTTPALHVHKGDAAVHLA